MSDPISGLLSVGSSLLEGDAAGDAADAQSAAAIAGVQENRRQFDMIRELLKPYVEAGAPALAQQQALVGLGGEAAQKSAISGIENSPTFQALLQQGANSLLQNASATGGLRGGNLQGALATFRPRLLAQQIEDKYAKLGGLTSLGQQSAVGVGNAGMATGANIANLLQQQGAAQAGGILGQARAGGGLLGDIAFSRGLGGLNRPTVPTPNVGWVSGYDL